MLFTILKEKNFIFHTKVVTLKQGDYETVDEKEIAILKGANDVTFEIEDDEEKALIAAREEFEKLTGKKPHHAAGVDKIKSDIKAFNESQEK